MNTEQNIAMEQERKKKILRQAYFALQVISKNKRIHEYLQENDPMAMGQVEDAISAMAVLIA